MKWNKTYPVPAHQKKIHPPARMRPRPISYLRILSALGSGEARRPPPQSASGSHIQSETGASRPNGWHSGNHEAAPAFPKKNPAGTPKWIATGKFPGRISIDKIFLAVPGSDKNPAGPGRTQKNIFPDAGRSRIHADSLLRMGQHVAPPPAVRPPTLDTHAPVMRVPGVILVQWSPDHCRIRP
jgi:hypothetical protein